MFPEKLTTLLLMRLLLRSFTSPIPNIDNDNHNAQLLNISSSLGSNQLVRISNKFTNVYNLNKLVDLLL